MQTIINKYTEYIEKEKIFTSHLETKKEYQNDQHQQMEHFDWKLQELEYRKQIIQMKEELLTLLKSYENETTASLKQLQVEKDQCTSEIKEIMKTILFLSSQNEPESKKLQYEMKRKFDSIEKEALLLSQSQLSQLEEWTQKKIGKILFDSEYDNWEKETTTFHEKLNNHSQLLFIVEDSQHEIFGYYLSTQFISDFNQYKQTSIDSFMFNIQSNGRLDGMKQFKMMKEGNGYYLYNPSEERLCCIGDIFLMKKQMKSTSLIFQNEYTVHDYNGISSAICGKVPNGFGAIEFDPIRFKVIQME